MSGLEVTYAALEHASSALAAAAGELRGLGGRVTATAGVWSGDAAVDSSIDRVATTLGNRLDAAVATLGTLGGNVSSARHSYDTADRGAVHGTDPGPVGTPSPAAAAPLSGGLTATTTAGVEANPSAAGTLRLTEQAARPAGDLSETRPGGEAS